jgi:RNA polymerase sigma-70 factor (ECF subfamily)
MISVTVDATECASANAKEFIRLLAAHSQSIYRHIFTLLPDPDQAQDVYQDAVMTLWEKFGEYRTSEPFLPWAYRFAHFKVLAHRKKNRRQPALLDDDVLNILAEEQVEENDRLESQLRLLPGCLEKLTQKERRLLEMRYDGRATVAQIAEETGRLADTLYRVLNRVRKKLLHCMESRLALEDRP